MTRSIYEVELVGASIVSCVIHLDRMQLDGDATLLLERVVVENLIHCHLARRHTPCPLQQSVCQCGLPVVNMRDDAKVAVVLHKTAKIRSNWTVGLSVYVNWWEID